MKERGYASKSYKLTISITVLYYNFSSLYIEVNAALLLTRLVNIVLAFRQMVLRCVLKRLMRKI